VDSSVPIATRQARPKSKRSQTKLTMRAETHELQHCIVWLSVDQHQVGLNVAVAEVFPIPHEGVVAVLLCQRLIIHQGCHNGNEVTLQRLAMRAWFRACSHA